MEKHIQHLLNRISLGFILIATINLTFILLSKPDTCVVLSEQPPRHRSAKSDHLLRFPESSCDAFRREFTTVERRNRRLWSTAAWSRSLASYSRFFLEPPRLLHDNRSSVLILSAGAGQPVMALRSLGVADVTGVDVVDSPPLVNKADAHSLPFFDSVFDLGFTSFFSEALFPSLMAAEMVRAVRVGGFCVLAVDECHGDHVDEIVGFFRGVELVAATNVTLSGSRMVKIVMRKLDSSF